MDQSRRVAVDAMGGDHAPRAAVEGAVRAAAEYGVAVLLVGDEKAVRLELGRLDGDGLPLVEVVHAPETVAMDESPVSALRQKQGSSIHLACEQVRAGNAGAVVSAGNSGAVMAVAMSVLGRLPGVDRPGIITSIPTSRGRACLLDAGANVECKPLHLVQFAIMAEIYARVVRGVAEPRVGLLSNGEEESKGTELTRAAHAVLSKLPLRYVGYIEGRDLNSGAVDVVVTDGFTGNVALKTMEGFAGCFQDVMRGWFENGLRGKLAYLLLRKSVAALRAHVDYAEQGGAPLLGVKGVTIIAHGSSTPKAIKNAVRMASEALAGDMNRKIIEEIGRMSEIPALAAEMRRGRRFWRQLRDRFRASHEGRDDPPDEGPT